MKRIRSEFPPLLQAWHGARRWEGSPELRTPKAGRAEWGPGIYGTTNYSTAHRYGAVRLLEFRPRLFLEQVSLALQLADDFIRQTVPKSRQGALIERLEDCTKRHVMTQRQPIGTGRQLHADVLRNMMVNENFCTGKKGLALAEFFTSLGIDAACAAAYGGEHWTVIFNPACIKRCEPVGLRQVDPLRMELESPLFQQAAGERSLKVIFPDGETREFPVASPTEAAIRFREIRAGNDSARGWLGGFALSDDGAIWAGSTRVMPAPKMEPEPVLGADLMIR